MPCSIAPSRVGNKVAAAPREVTLWFTQKLEAAFSTITVTNAAGERVDTGKTRVSGSQMSVSLRPGGSGTYRVTWHVLSVDSHTTDGNFTFQGSVGARAWTGSVQGPMRPRP